MRVIKGTRVKAVLPNVADLAPSQVKPARIIVMRPAERRSQRSFRLRNCQEVDMIAHEAIPGKANTPTRAVVSHQFQVEPAI